MFYDISVTIDPRMLIYPGDTPFAKKYLHHFDHQDTLVISQFWMHAHCGTHVDAPYHFIQQGKKITDLSIDKFCGPAKVIPIEKASITIDEVSQYDITAGDIVLFKTKNQHLLTSGVFHEEYVFLDKKCAQYLVQKRVKMVGIDYLSIDPFGKAGSHHVLLGNDILILEMIDLRAVEAGDYYLYAFPLKIMDAEATPVRAVLEKRDKI